MAEPPESDAPTTPPAPWSVIADVHEPPAIQELLRQRGVPVVRQKLQPADYVIGEAAVERKTISDFFSSMVRKRLFDQCSRLAASYKEPYLLLEGDVAEFMQRKQPQAVWGAMVRIAFDMRVPILPAPTQEASAQFLYVLWNRERKEPSHTGASGSGASDAPSGAGGLRGGIRWKPPGFASPAEEQKFVLQGMPLVGDRLSENLLDQFGTLRRAFNATPKELLRVPLMGDVKARAFNELLDRPFPRKNAKLETD